MVILAGLLDAVQDFYLRWLGRNLMKRRTLLINELLFAGSGITSAIVFILLNGGFQKETGVWTGVITAAAVVYGTGFWAVNRLIVARAEN